jgi:hypothetical protein
MGATKKLLDDMEHESVFQEQRPQYYIAQSESDSKYYPAILTDDLKEEVADGGYAIYDTIQECQDACDNLNEDT